MKKQISLMCIVMMEDYKIIRFHSNFVGCIQFLE